jgi:hypothetical protein
MDTSDTNTSEDQYGDFGDISSDFKRLAGNLSREK